MVLITSHIGLDADQWAHFEGVFSGRWLSEIWGHVWGCCRMEQVLKILTTCFGVPLQLLGLRAFGDSNNYSEHLARKD